MRRNIKVELWWILPRQRCVEILVRSLSQFFAMPLDRRSDNGDARNGSTIIAIVGSLTAVSSLFVAARLYVRIKLMRSIGLDDYLIVLAMVNASALGIGSVACIVVAYKCTRLPGLASDDFSCEASS